MLWLGQEIYLKTTTIRSFKALGSFVTDLGHR